MPRIKGYTPAWLSEPVSGYDHGLFSPDEESNSTSLTAAQSKTGPIRTIARARSMVFVAVGKEIRWADLIQLRDVWQKEVSVKRERSLSGVRIKPEESDEADEPGDDEVLDAAELGVGFRTIKPSVGSDIRQLVVSPYEDYLAVLTTHTVRILAVPELGKLKETSIEPITPRAWTLGPTTHVMDRSSIASALWHPLGVNGSALVTVTTDAVVRVWELSPVDRWSFDKPTLTIDLKKLADGTCLDQDFTACPNVSRHGFSPDSFEMDVAAAAFASRGSGGWSPMTLWIAMRGGDVYALCPLLPNRWAPTPALLASLSVTVSGNKAVAEHDPHASARAKLLARQRFEWMAHVDNQEPVQAEGPFGQPDTQIYTRPSEPGIVPRLQGPFELQLSPDSETDLDVKLSDIFVIGQKLDMAELMAGEDQELLLNDVDNEGLSLTVIGLLSPTGQLRLCLDDCGVEAEWLPSKKASKSEAVRSAHMEETSLLTIQTLDTLTPLEGSVDGWPVFSEDVTSRYDFYVTHPTSITHISLKAWVFRLDQELQDAMRGLTEGSDLRLDLLAKNLGTRRDRLHTSSAQGESSVLLAAAVALRDPDLGYFLLSATPYEPIALMFEDPEVEVEVELEPKRSESPVLKSIEAVPAADLYEPRPSFRPPRPFDIPSELPTLLEQFRSSRHKTLADREVRLSPLTMQIFAQAHRMLSHETVQLKIGAADLFQRLQTMPQDVKQLVQRANVLRLEIEAASGQDLDAAQPESHNANLARRMQAAKDKNEVLAQRMEKLRRAVVKHSRELSDKERLWFREVHNLEAVVSPSASQVDEAPPRLKDLRSRYDEVTSLAADLVPRALELAQHIEPSKEADMGEGSQVSGSGSKVELRIPTTVRKAKISQVHEMLERETILLDATNRRLERLSIT